MTISDEEYKALLNKVETLMHRCEMLQNRCYALTHGAVCQWCPYEDCKNRVGEVLIK